MNRLRELRKEKKISLRDLADALNMSFSNIASIERGEVQLREDTSKIFCDFFDVSSDYLLGFSDERRPLSAKEELKLRGIKLTVYNQLEELTEEQAKEALKYIDYLKKRGDV